MVPRLSLPAMTSARLTPSVGRSTVCRTYVSRLPFSIFSSSFLSLMSCRMRGDSRLPTRIHRESDGVAVSVARVPVTRAKSALRLSSAMRMPASCSSDRMGSGLPARTRGKLPASGRKVMKGSAPKEATLSDSATRERNSLFISLVGCSMLMIRSCLYKGTVLRA